MVEIATSILNIQSNETVKTFYQLETAKTDYFHIDVMDGKFVQQDTTQRMYLYSTELKHITNIPLDIHFMVEDIQRYCEEYFSLKPDSITFHIEACHTPEEVKKHIQSILNNHCKVGIAINPNTSIEEIYRYLPYIHRVLVMTVEPGYGGQTLIPDTIEKVRALHQYIKQENLEVDIVVDGGITLDNHSQLIQAGANILIAGSTILKSENYKETILKLRT